MTGRLLLLALVSSLLFLGTVRAPVAHEVTPTIADFRVEAGAFQLALRINLEAFILGINLDGMRDTDASAQSDAYDTLRVLPPEGLEPKARAFLDSWLPRLAVEAGGPIPLAVDRLEIPPVANAELPRQSLVYLSGVLPEGAEDLTFGWPAGAGEMVLRQQGVSEPFTGFLVGGMTAGPIALSGGNTGPPWQGAFGAIPVGFALIWPAGLVHVMCVLGLFLLGALGRNGARDTTLFASALVAGVALGMSETLPISARAGQVLLGASLIYIAAEAAWARRAVPRQSVGILLSGGLHGVVLGPAVNGALRLSDGGAAVLAGVAVGVALAMLCVLAGAYLLVGAWFAGKPWYRQRVVVPAAIGLCLFGVAWGGGAFGA